LRPPRIRKTLKPIKLWRGIPSHPCSVRNQTVVRCIRVEDTVHRLVDICQCDVMFLDVRSVSDEGMGEVDDLRVCILQVYACSMHAVLRNAVRVNTTSENRSSSSRKFISVK